MQIHFLQPTQLTNFIRNSLFTLESTENLPWTPYGLRFSKKECNSDLMYIAMEFCETPDGGVAASHDSLVENMVQGNPD